jgi:hypothetical protein
MNAVWIVLFAIFALWGVIAAVIVGVDQVARRRYREQLEVRDWTEKVEAMRRLTDEEGAE